jgi:hypothetical protein
VLPRTNHGTPLVWEPTSIAQSNNWSTSSNLLNLCVVVGQTLSVIRKVNQGDPSKDETTPVSNPATALQTAVAIAASQARPSSGDELIAVGAEGNPQVVTNSKGIDGGSSATEIHLPATEAAEVSTYPVELTLSGGWGQNRQQAG